MNENEKFNLEKDGRQLYNLLSINLNQLRTFAAVCEKLSLRQGGKMFGLEQTSVIKQLDTLERHFEHLTGSKLIVRSSERGGNIKLTKSGERVLEFANNVLKSAYFVHNDLQKLRKDAPIKIALTTFMIHVLSQIQTSLVKEFERNDLKLIRDLEHTRSGSIQSILKDRDIDFSLGGFIAKSSEDSESYIDDELEFVEFKRENLGLISNYDLQCESISFCDLEDKKIPLLVPKQGLINDLLHSWFGDDEEEILEEKLKILEWCDDVHFAMDLLYLKLYEEASMISTKTIATVVKERPNAHEFIRFCEIHDCNHQLRVGLFRRKEDRHIYHKQNPRIVFWNAFIKISQNPE